MVREELLRLFEDLIELPVRSLTGDEPLAGFENWNSMAMLGFMAIADEHCHISLSPRQFIHCQTVSDLLDLVKVPAE
jgi:acyl carrier protein